MKNDGISMIFTLRNQEKTGGFDDNIIEPFEVGLGDVIRQEYKGYRWDLHLERWKLHLKRPAWASVIRQEAKGYRSVMSDFRHIVMAFHSDDGVIWNKRRDFRSEKML